MPISFPTGPATNDTYTYASKTWTWTGSVWQANATPQGPTGPTGPTGTTGLTISTSQPASTNVLWLDSDEPANATVLPLGGTTGQVLAKTSASDYATGWVDPRGARNAIINGGFDIWQRGTTFSSVANGTYTADRWKFVFDGTGATRNITQQVFAPGTAPVAGYEAPYFLRVAQTVAGSAGTYNVLQQPIEDVRTFAGQTVTISFWAKADAARTLNTSFDRNYGTAGSAAEYYLSSASFSLTTSWQRFSATVSIASLSGKTLGAASYLMFNFVLPLNVTQTIDIWGVQIEAGSAATPFVRNANSLQGELAACQRYYWRANSSASATATGFGVGISTSTTNARIFVKNPVTMRVAPTSIEFANLAISDKSAYTLAATAITMSHSQEDVVDVSVTNTTGTTAFRSAFLIANASSAAYLGFSAEL